MVESGPGARHVDPLVMASLRRPVLDHSLPTGGMERLGAGTGERLLYFVVISDFPPTLVIIGSRRPLFSKGPAISPLLISNFSNGDSLLPIHLDYSDQQCKIVGQIIVH